MPSPLLLHPKSDDAYGEIVSITPNGIDWKYVYFTAIRVAAGTAYASATGDNEVALVFIEGTASVRSSAGEWPGVGARESPFAGPPNALYLPPDCTYTIDAIADCEIAICAASARGVRKPARLHVLNADDAHIRGTGQAQRTIYNILMDPDDASSLFVTEVVTPAGNWSSYPPHKHDRDDPPNESALEEIYYYRARPAGGFAFQRVYTPEKDLDESIAARDRDVVLVPRGYHVCAAAPGYEIYYLNVLAGPKHVYHMTFDPAHAWIKEGWTW